MNRSCLLCHKSFCRFRITTENATISVHDDFQCCWVHNVRDVRLSFPLDGSLRDTLDGLVQTMGRVDLRLPERRMNIEFRGQSGATNSRLVVAYADQLIESLERVYHAIHAQSKRNILS